MMMSSLISIYTITALALFGLVLGSFVGAQVWRLRARQLIDDFASDEPDIDTEELAKLAPLTDISSTSPDDRSRCLDCGHSLAWYDLIPLASWLSTGGRCRYCRRPIGLFEPLIELAMAGFFVVSYLVWPTPLDSWSTIGQFAIWLMAGVALAVLFVYDARWYLLPDVATLSLAVLAALFAGLGLIGSPNLSGDVIQLVSAVALLSGLYAALYYYSRWRNGEDGVWVGFGDVKLGVGLGLLAGTWPIAFLALFLANLIGTLLVLPGLITGKLSRQAHVPLGPLLILGTVIVVWWGQRIIDWYLGFSIVL